MPWALPGPSAGTHLDSQQAARVLSADELFLSPLVQQDLPEPATPVHSKEGTNHLAVALQTGSTSYP